MALIDSDVLIKEFKSNPTDGLYTSEIIAVVREAPEVNPVHAAGGCYCRECELWRRYTVLNHVYNRGHCRACGIEKHENGFCDNGRRREDA